MISKPLLASDTLIIIFILINLLLEPPEVASDVPEKSNLTVQLHRRLVLKCPITGSPQPKITWYKVSFMTLSPWLLKVWFMLIFTISNDLVSNRKVFQLKNNLVIIFTYHLMVNNFI